MSSWIYGSAWSLLLQSGTPESSLQCTRDPHDLLVNTEVFFVAGATAEQIHEGIWCIDAKLRTVYLETNRISIESESLPRHQRDKAQGWIM
jgi:hypothetical protein